VFLAHGGDVICTSEPGVGSMFVISLPASPQPSTETEPDDSTAAKTRLL
jgi:signal transduction histidine kinase